MAISISSSAPVVALAALRESICARTNEDSVSCWGNSFGTFDGQNGEMHTPQLMPSLSGKLIALDRVEETTCAYYEDQLPLCWGENNGSLVNVDFPNYQSRLPLLNLESVTSSPVFQWFENN